MLLQTMNCCPEGAAVPLQLQCVALLQENALGSSIKTKNQPDTQLQVCSSTRPSKKHHYPIYTPTPHPNV